MRGHVAGMLPAPSSPQTAFDSLAEGYDAAFSDTRIGRAMRSAVWQRLDALYQPGDRIFELNCGTGEDAVHLAHRGIHVLATDSSAAMVAITREKALAAGVADNVTAQVLAIEECEEVAGQGPFDGVVSNFGGLNCVSDLTAVGESLGRLVRPGGKAILCVMGPVVPWEWAWYLLRGRPRKAFRRLRRGGVEWQGITIRYPTTGSLRRAFSAYFSVDCVSAIGVLMPPPYAENWAVHHPRLFDILTGLERRYETLWPLPFLADHYVFELVRREGSER